MAYLIQKPAPQWTCEALMPDKEIKPISLSDYAGKYLVLFYYPLDFTFVCPTEIIAYSEAAAKFKAINCEVVAASCDNKFTHLAWVNTPRSEGGLGEMQIPILADFTKEIASNYGALIDQGDDKGVPLRALYIISDKGVVRHMTMNDLPVGRNVDETLRLVEAYQYTDTHGEVCPAGWKRGDPTMKDDPTGKLEYFSKGYTEGTGIVASGGAGGAMENVAGEEQFRSTISGASSAKPVVVMYSAGWCGNCKKVAPSVNKLATELMDTTNFIKVDSEALQFVEDEFDVSSLPTFQVFKGGAKPEASFTGSATAKVIDFIKANV